MKHKHDWEYAGNIRNYYYREDCNGCGNMRIIEYHGPGLVVNMYNSLGDDKKTIRWNPGERDLRKFNNVS